MGSLTARSGRSRALAALTACVALLATVLASTAAPAAGAVTRWVSTTGTDSGNCSLDPCRTINYALAQAVAGDTVSVAAGSYAGPVMVQKAVTIEGAGAGQTVIDRSLAPPNVVGTAVFVQVAGTAVIRGVTIRNGTGYNGYGGGVLVFAGTTRLEQVRVTGNTVSAVGNVSLGGGVAVYLGARAEIVGSTIDANSTSGGFGLSGGGGVWSGGELELVDSTLEGDGAGALGIGGGVFVQAPGTLQADQTRIIGSSAYLGGGLAASATTATFDGGEIAGNVATGAAVGGGGVWLGNAGADVTLTGTSVAENRATAANGLGGGLLASTGELTLEQATITGNTAPLGGGLATAAGVRLDATGGAFTGNGAANSGGAVYQSGSGTIDGTLVDGNTAGFAGGGIFVGSAGAADTPAIELTNTSLIENQAVVMGGGIAVWPNASVGAGASELIANTAANGGGIIVSEGGSATLSGADVRGNTAAGGFGGGAFNAGRLSIDSSTFTGNVAVPSNAQTGFGGAVYNASTNAAAVVTLDVAASTFDANRGFVGSVLFNAGQASVRRSTISGNVASGFGAVAATGGTATLSGMTLAGNVAESGAYGGIVASGSAQVGVAGSIVAGNTAPNCSGPGFGVAPVDGGHNLTDPAGGACGFAPANGSLVGDPQLAALADNGGTTATRLPGPSSPAIDAVAPTATSPLTDAVTGEAVVLCTGTDQRGVARPQGPACDIGSVEVPVEAPTLDGDPAPVFVVGEPGGPVAYSATGVPTPALSVTAGTLPEGLSFVDGGDGTGSLAGTPAEGTAGTHPITLTADNGIDPPAQLDVTIQVNEAPELSGPAEVAFVVDQPGGAAYAADGTPTPAITLADGTLPAGVTLVDNGDGTATLGGTAQAGTEGTYPVTLAAGNGVGQPSTLAVTVIVEPELEIVTEALPDGTVGSAYGAQLESAGGAPPVAWSLTEGSLPAGLALSGDGAISGTPTGPAGTATFTVTAVESSEQPRSASRELSITIHPGDTALAVDPVVLQTSGGLIKLTVGKVSAVLTGGDAEQPVAGRAIVFKAGSVTVCTATTNAQGRASCILNVADTLRVVLAGGVTAAFAGDGSWNPSAGSNGLL